MKMKILVKVISALFLLFSGITNTGCDPFSPGKSDSACKGNNAFGEDEPIILHGHVRAGGGGAISGASIVLFYAGTIIPAYSATSDSGGDYDINPVTAGSYNVEIRKSGYVTKTYPLSISATITRTDTLVHE
jgi:hypothetical protein